MLETQITTSANAGMFACKYAGDLANGLRVSVFAANDSTAFSNWTYASAFNRYPSTSAYANTRGGSNEPYISLLLIHSLVHSQVT